MPIPITWFPAGPPKHPLSSLTPGDTFCFHEGGAVYMLTHKVKDEIRIQPVGHHTGEEACSGRDTRPVLLVDVEMTATIRLPAKAAAK